MAPPKFGRNYLLLVQVDDVGTMVTIVPPFTIEFDITRNTMSAMNVGQIRIYNLSLKTRNLIRFNLYNYNSFRLVELRAGYGTNLPVVFRGNINEAWSVREGTNFITQIECYDGGFGAVNGIADGLPPFPAGTSQEDMLAALIASETALPNVSLGAIGAWPANGGRSCPVSGNTVEIIRRISNEGAFFVDNGKGNVLRDDEIILTVGNTIINNESGLLGTPLLEQGIVHFDMLFEPSLVVGQKVTLGSITESAYNGEYKLVGLKHRGMISEAVCGDVVTTCDFLYFKDFISVASASQ